MSHKPYSINTLRDTAWAGLLRAQARLVSSMNAALVAEELLDMSSYDVLITLKRAPEHQLRLSELADRVVLSRSGLTRLVDRLEQQGYLKRATDKADRRGQFAILKYAGDVALLRTWTVYSKLIQEQFGSRISDSEARVLRDVFARLAPPLASAPVEVTVKGKKGRRKK
jgi:DNA-binding MarR family transcriptional regulator